MKKEKDKKVHEALIDLYLLLKPKKEDDEVITNFCFNIKYSFSLNLQIL